MIIFERTENIPVCGDTFYDGIKLEITGGYETTIDAYLNYFIVFLESLSFTHEQIIEFLKDYVAELNGEVEVKYED